MTKLTISEARAEVCTTVLYLILKAMPAKRRQRLWKAAVAEAEDVGLDILRAETAWLFRGLPAANALCQLFNEFETPVSPHRPRLKRQRYGKRSTKPR